ncbi:MAG: tyrosine-type recombinase/integrase [Dehalococcoidia bacterium]|nr:tyrosine-type recombinase/integrase [Dehalococcoidia bacterium]
MRIHDLRHSAASMLLADGVPVKVVSETLGHADVSTTLSIYAHVLEGAQEQAAKYMGRLFQRLEGTQAHPLRGPRTYQGALEPHQRGRRLPQNGGAGRMAEGGKRAVQSPASPTRGQAAFALRDAFPDDAGAKPRLVITHGRRRAPQAQIQKMVETRES